MGKTRAIRLNDSDDKLITEFLISNPVFDFSTLARTAILSFIRDPKLSIKPVQASKIKTPSEKVGARHAR